jgi:hypothetical protein
MIKWFPCFGSLDHLDAKLNPDTLVMDNNNWFLFRRNPPAYFDLIR